MKTARDPRHIKRAHAIQALYAWSFQPEQPAKDELAGEVVSHLTQIDPLVKLSAPNRPINQINRIDLSILRLAIFELVVKKDAPYKVIVDEGVELAKEFGAEASPAFINGALGNLIEQEHIN